MTFRKSATLAAMLAAPLALVACSDSDDASYESDTETVEIEANEALENIDAEPVADPQAAAPDPVTTTATQAIDQEAAEAARQQSIQDEGDDAAATAAAAADAMIEE